VLALLLCSCSQEINEQVNNSSGDHYSNSSEPYNNSSVDHNNNSAEPYNNSLEIDIASRGWVDIKTVTETIDGVSYSVRHCVNLFTSSDYEYTYYKLCYIGGSLRRVDTYGHCTHELVPYQQFIDHLESESHRLALDNFDRDLNNPVCGTHMVYLYSSSGTLKEYQVSVDEIHKSIYKYDDDGRLTYKKSWTFEQDDPVSVNSKYEEEFYLYYASGKVKEYQRLVDGKRNRHIGYWDKGNKRFDVTYCVSIPPGMSQPNIWSLYTYYYSGYLEYIFDRGSNNYVTHRTDGSNATSTTIANVTKDRYAADRIFESYLINYYSEN